MMYEYEYSREQRENSEAFMYCPTLTASFRSWYHTCSLGGGRKDSNKDVNNVIIQALRVAGDSARYDRVRGRRMERNRRSKQLQ